MDDGVTAAAASVTLLLDLWACTRSGSRSLAAKLHELPAVLWWRDVHPESVRAVAWLTLPVNVAVVGFVVWRAAVGA